MNPRRFNMSMAAALAGALLAVNHDAPQAQESPRDKQPVEPPPQPVTPTVDPVEEFTGDQFGNRQARRAQARANKKRSK